VDTAAESHLRFLAQQTLGRAQPDEEILAASLGLYAAANAYVMLGLLDEPTTEEVLAAASDALTARGLRPLGLSIRSGAHDYWQLRSQGRDGLSWTPRAVGAIRLQLALAAADMRFEWLRVSHSGMRFRVQATATARELPPRQAGSALADVSLADDAGHRYQMSWDSGSGQYGLWVGDVVATPEPPAEVAWFDLRARGMGAAFRVAVPPSPPIRAVTVDPPWPTAAESYLALLCAQDPPPAIGSGYGRHVAATVAEALLVVGAIPEHSPLLPLALGRERRSSHPVLPTTWPNPVRRTTPPDLQVSLCAALPFADAAVVIEGLSAWGEDVQLHLYGWPWVDGERWPMAIPSFTVHAFDDLDGKHEGRVGSRQSYGGGEGHGDFTLWPGVPARVRKLRVVVSTLWESAWADLILPRDTGWPGNAATVGGIDIDHG
jgi:hypothetical protein